MIRHQAVSPNLGFRLGRGFGQQGSVKPIIAVAEKGRLAAVATLGNVMRYPWNH
jgi:hypothetical protein